MLYWEQFQSESVANRDGTLNLKRVFPVTGIVAGSGAVPAHVPGLGPRSAPPLRQEPMLPPRLAGVDLMLILEYRGRRLDARPGASRIPRTAGE